LFFNGRGFGWIERMNCFSPVNNVSLGALFAASIIYFIPHDTLFPHAAAVSFIDTGRPGC